MPNTARGATWLMREDQRRGQRSKAPGPSKTGGEAGIRAKRGERGEPGDA